MTEKSLGKFSEWSSNESLLFSTKKSNCIYYHTYQKSGNFSVNITANNTSTEKTGAATVLLTMIQSRFVVQSKYVHLPKKKKERILRCFTGVSPRESCLPILKSFDILLCLEFATIYF